MPRVSVIIPTYNRPALLAQTLESIYHQTFQDFEIIVVDDGTPGQANKNVCRRFEKIRYFKIPNSGGPMVPRNKGIKEALGEYIAFVDDDDLWLPYKLKKQVEILDENPDYGLVHSYCKVIDEEGIETGEIIGRLKEPMKKHGYVFDKIVGSFTVMMPTPLIRAEVIEQSGGFNVEMPAGTEDMEFFCRVAFYTPFYFMDEATVLYRSHSAGISKENFNYVYLPLFLAEMLTKLREKEGLNFKRFREIRKKILLMQVAKITNACTAKIALKNLVRISPYFIFYPKLLWALLLRFSLISKSSAK